MVTGIYIHIKVQLLISSLDTSAIGLLNTLATSTQTVTKAAANNSVLVNATLLEAKVVTLKLSGVQLLTSYIYPIKYSVGETVYCL